MSIWKEVKDYPNYEVSDDGQVRNISTGITLKPWKNNSYLCITLCREGEKANFRIHRLVAEAFVDGYGRDLEVDHINRDRLDNRAINLRWVTRQDNQRNSSRNRKVINETTGDVFGSLAEACEWLVANQLSKNIKSATVSLWNCLNNKTKTCGRCEWCYGEDI